MYLAPGAQLWVDLWLPRADPLWVDDVTTAAEWVGEWWKTALERSGLRHLDVHVGPARPGTLGKLVCFAGRGPGEVLHGGRKVVGLSQWRARQGVLFSTSAYRRWDPVPLAELVEAGEEHPSLAEELGAAAIGLSELDPRAGDLAVVRDRLLSSLSGFSPLS